MNSPKSNFKTAFLVSTMVIEILKKKKKKFANCFLFSCCFYWLLLHVLNVDVF